MESCRASGSSSRYSILRNNEYSASQRIHSLVPLPDHITSYLKPGVCFPIQMLPKRLSDKEERFGEDSDSDDDA